jgi:GNAT superfamily N-acetyltransferase
VDPFETTLRDGGRALLRPLQPDDRWRITEGFDQLTPAARYLRFGQHMEELSEDMLDQLMDVDDKDHVAWVALDPDHLDEPGLGVARFIREPYETWAAEAAVTVAEGQRGRGVGTLLIKVISQVAREVGITEFRNYVLAENDAMLGVFRHLGAQVTSVGRVLRLDMPLTIEDVDTDDAATQILRAMAEHVAGDA